jgi:hypothetical protein
VVWRLGVEEILLIMLLLFAGGGCKKESFVHLGSRGRYIGCDWDQRHRSDDMSML